MHHGNLTVGKHVDHLVAVKSKRHLAVKSAGYHIVVPELQRLRIFLLERCLSLVDLDIRIRFLADDAALIQILRQVMDIIGIIQIGFHANRLQLCRTVHEVLPCLRLLLNTGLFKQIFVIEDSADPGIRRIPVNLSIFSVGRRGCRVDPGEYLHIADIFRYALADNLLLIFCRDIEHIGHLPGGS